MSTPARWILPPSPAEEVAALARQCGLRLPAARVLWARGLRDARSVEHFLNPKLGDLHDPFLLKGMEAAVERVRAAVQGGERVLLYGDYDTDGTAAVVILKKALEALGLDAAFHIPDRLKDGYG